ncbi:MAG: nucleotidyltransferase family protein [Gemmiger sp.]
MKFVGIIAEYDPFHNGHAAQLAMLRQKGAQTIAVCLSTGATQRGRLPFLPEAVRVNAALRSGADLVVALPAPYACASAEGFAAAGVRLLTALGCDTLAFGAETPEADALCQAATLLESDDWRRRLRLLLDDGVPFAAARAAAADSLLPGLGALLQSPNNNLGVEYCRALLRQRSPMTPLPLPRVGAAHGGQTTGSWQGKEIASASFLRQNVDPALWRRFVPPATGGPASLLDDTRFSVAVLARLRGKTAADFAGLRGMNEGLDHRLEAAVRKARDVEALYGLLSTKRYPNARLRRLVLDAALEIPAALPPAPWLHVLGARRDALPLLKNAALPVSTSLAELVRGGTEAALIGELHSRAVDFSALCRDGGGPMGLAFTAKPVVI